MASASGFGEISDTGKDATAPKDDLVVAVEDVPQIDNVKWFGLRASDGDTLVSAAVFDTPIKNQRFIKTNNFDVIDLAPFDDKVRDEDIVGGNLRILTEMGDKDFILRMAINKVTGESTLRDRNSDAVLRIVNHEVKEGKRPLIVHGHGGGQEWEIGGGKDQYRSIKADTLLKNLCKILQDVKPEVSETLTERYNAVIIESCNGQTALVDPTVIETVGVPVIYTTEIAQIGGGKNRTVFALPKDYDPPQPDNSKDKAE